MTQYQELGLKFSFHENALCPISNNRCKAIQIVDNRSLLESINVVSRERSGRSERMPMFYNHHFNSSFPNFNTTDLKARCPTPILKLVIFLHTPMSSLKRFKLFTTLHNLINCRKFLSEKFLLTF